MHMFHRFTASVTKNISLKQKRLFLSPFAAKPAPDDPTREDGNEKKRKWFGRKKEKEQVDPLAGVERFKSEPDKGLTQEQVDLRVSQGLINSAPPKYSKTYKSIFLGNICSVFNLLCIACAIALALAHAPYTLPMSSSLGDM